MHELLDMSDFVHQDTVEHVYTYMKDKWLLTQDRQDELVNLVHTSPIVLLILEQIFKVKRHPENGFYLNLKAKTRLLKLYQILCFFSLNN